MFEERVYFVKFATKDRDNHLYATDDAGTIWVSTNGMEWESIEPTPRRIRQGLTAGQLMQLMQRKGTQIV